jgi:hypothetical protein
MEEPYAIPLTIVPPYSLEYLNLKNLVWALTIFSIIGLWEGAIKPLNFLKQVVGLWAGPIKPSYIKAIISSIAHPKYPIGLFNMGNHIGEYFRNPFYRLLLKKKKTNFYYFKGLNLLNYFLQYYRILKFSFIPLTCMAKPYAITLFSSKLYKEKNMSAHTNTLNLFLSQNFHFKVFLKLLYWQNWICLCHTDAHTKYSTAIVSISNRSLNLKKGGTKIVGLSYQRPINISQNCRDFDHPKYVRAIRHTSFQLSMANRFDSHDSNITFFKKKGYKPFFLKECGLIYNFIEMRHSSAIQIHQYVKGYKIYKTHTINFKITLYNSRILFYLLNYGKTIKKSGNICKLNKTNNLFLCLYLFNGYTKYSFLMHIIFYSKDLSKILILNTTMGYLVLGYLKVWQNYALINLKKNYNRITFLQEVNSNFYPSSNVKDGIAQPLSKYLWNYLFEKSKLIFIFKQQNLNKCFTKTCLFNELLNNLFKIILKIEGIKMNYVLNSYYDNFSYGENILFFFRRLSYFYKYKENFLNILTLSNLSIKKKKIFHTEQNYNLIINRNNVTTNTNKDTKFLFYGFYIFQKIKPKSFIKKQFDLNFIMGSNQKILNSRDIRFTEDILNFFSFEILFSPTNNYIPKIYSWLFNSLMLNKKFDSKQISKKLDISLTKINIFEENLLSESLKISQNYKNLFKKINNCKIFNLYYLVTPYLILFSNFNKIKNKFYFIEIRDSELNRTNFLYFSKTQYIQNQIKQKIIINRFKIIILPIKENLKNHLNQIKDLFFKVQGESQETLIKKISPIINKWSDYYKIIPKNSNKLQFLLIKILWKWCSKRHNHVSNSWIKEKYFFSLNNKKYLFCFPLQNKASAKLPTFKNNLTFFLKDYKSTKARFRSSIQTQNKGFVLDSIREKILLLKPKFNLNKFGFNNNIKPTKYFWYLKVSQSHALINPKFQSAKDVHIKSVFFILANYY